MSETRYLRKRKMPYEELEKALAKAEAALAEANEDKADAFERAANLQAKLAEKDQEINVQKLRATLAEEKLTSAEMTTKEAVGATWKWRHLDQDRRARIASLEAKLANANNTLGYAQRSAKSYMELYERARSKIKEHERNWIKLVAHHNQLIDAKDKEIAKLKDEINKLKGK